MLFSAGNFPTNGAIKVNKDSISLKGFWYFVLLCSVLW